METRVESALKTFENIFNTWGNAKGRLEKVAHLAYIWTPENCLPQVGKKDIHLTLQAITHGNEVGGIQVLQTCLELLKSGLLKPEISISFILGNPYAALENRRFLNRDLNRAFGRHDVTFEEDRRARELEPLLERSYYFLDFHQTIEPTSKPFFIFPFTRPCFAFAHALHHEIPIVTHWGTPFSKDGMCTDEYVNFRGGVGITIELGQKSFDAYQSGVGLYSALAAMRYAQAHAMGGSPSFDVQHEEIFTWRRVVPYESGMALSEGLVNFQVLKSGQVIGSSLDGDLKVPLDGWLLFPKYLRDPLASPPKEIFRIMKRIEYSQLGLEGVIGS